MEYSILAEGTFPVDRVFNCRGRLRRDNSDRVVDILKIREIQQHLPGSHLLEGITHIPKEKKRKKNRYDRKN